MPSRVRNWVALNPLMRLALGGAAGIMLAEQGLAHGHEWAILMTGVAFCAGTLVLPRRFPLEACGLFVCAFIHGVRAGETFTHPLRTELGSEERAEVRVIAYVIPIAHRDVTEDDARPLALYVSRAEFQKRGLRLDGPARIRGWMARGSPSPAPGTYELLGRLRFPASPANPGEFDAVAHALRQGIVAEMDVRSLRLLESDWLPVHAWFLTAAENCRQWISAQVERGIEGENEAIGLIRAMALGATDETSPDMERPFRNTGTLHVFAVSGLHVGLISFLGWMVLRGLGVGRNLALGILIPAVFCYAFITGWRPSAARAAIMIAVMMAAPLVNRQSRLQNSLGAAALLLFASDSHQLFMPGFQLSFGVLWAIALFAVPLMNLLKPWTQLDPFLPAHLASSSQLHWSRLKTWFAQSICVSTAAWAGSLPLMLWHFQLATPIAVLANCVLVPLSFCLLATTCVAVALAACHCGLGQILANNCNWLFARLMLGSAILFAKVPGGSASWNPRQVSGSEGIDFTVLRLPYGQAAQHLRIGSAHWLFDTGDSRGFARVVRPFLQHHGIDALDGVFLSHGDIEHVGGAIRVFEEYSAGKAYLSGLEPWRFDPGFSGMKQLWSANRSNRLFHPQHLAAGDVVQLGRGATAMTLYPRMEDRHDKADDRALVVRLDFEGFRILWCNDIGFIAEKALLGDRARAHDLRCEVLVRNQHSTDFSGLSDFLLAVRPRIIVSSNVPFVAAQRMPRSLAEYAGAARATLFDQHIDGAVTLEIRGDHLSARAFASGKQAALTLPDTSAGP